MGLKEWHKSELPKISFCFIYSRLGATEAGYPETPRSKERKKIRKIQNPNKSLFSRAKKTKKRAI